MVYDPAIGVRFAAFEAALLAKLNDLDQATVDGLREKTERELPDPDNPVRRAVIGFVTQYEMVRGNPDALRALGEDLGRFIDHSLVPDPPDMDRSDIHG